MKIGFEAHRKGEQNKTRIKGRGAPNSGRSTAHVARRRGRCLWEAKLVQTPSEEQGTPCREVCTVWKEGTLEKTGKALPPLPVL